jgi:hypothetical protein
MLQSDERIRLGESREPEDNNEPFLWRLASVLVLTLACASTTVLLVGFFASGRASMETAAILLRAAWSAAWAGAWLTPIAVLGTVGAWLNGWSVARWIKAVVVLLFPWALLIVLGG